MPREINSAKYSDLLRKLTELQGALRIDLLEELRPVLVVENDRPEWFFLRREQLCRGLNGVTSIVTTLPEEGIFNPPASGKLVIVTRHSVFATAGPTSLQERYITALPAGNTINNSGFRDTRSRPGGPFVGVTTAAQVWSATPLVIDGGLPDASYRLQTDVQIDTMQGNAVILSPGTGLLWGIAAVGVNTVNGTIDWYEKNIGAES